MKNKQKTLANATGQRCFRGPALAFVGPHWPALACVER